MPNLKKPDNIIDAGTVKRGKYTLPNTEAFATNVEEILLNESAKKLQKDIIHIQNERQRSKGFAHVK